MESLVECVIERRNDNIDGIIERRLREFRELGKAPISERFSELCFCLLTANYSAEGGIRIQKSIGDGFITLAQDKLALRLKELGHRFPAARAGYIVEARSHMDSLEELLEKPDAEARDWLVENIRGLGYKEASHFLRNIGFVNLAIIDFHIVDILVKYGLIERPRTLTRKRYLEIEGVLRKFGEKMGMNMAELDLYLWYCETGKVLK